MKKSLSLLLSIALIFGAFASAASAAESDLTTQQKYDALAAKGIFAGINGEAALDQKMTRAQFARVLALILGLEGIGNPDTKVVSEKPFSDVKVDAWYAEEVAAVKEAGAMVGNADGTFNPQGNVTVQELAVAIAQALKLEPVKDAKVEGAADWAAGYIQALKDAGISVPTNYTEAATRGQLVDATYAADLKLNPPEPAKVSVVSAKATGVSKVEVALDKAVDTEKAKFELKYGTAAVTLDKTTWSEDKKTATLTLKDTQIKNGTYTVTLTGLEDDAVANKSATFQGENETVKKIEFVTASDEIAKSQKAQIKVRAENQYGELASFSVSAYTVNTGTVASTKKIDDEGYLIVSVNTSSLSTGLDVVPVYVYFNDTRITANKTFRVGATPFVQKLELGEVTYSNVNAKALVSAGNVAKIPVDLFDQYGNPVTPDQVVADGLTVNWSYYITPYTDALQVTHDDENDQYYVKVNVGANKKIEKTGQYQVNIFAGAATQAATIEVKSVKVAKNVKIGDPTKTIAAGDSEAIIPITVTDEEGNELTAQEIVDNKSRIEVSTGARLIEYGKDKGKIKVTAIPTTKNAYFNVTVLIKSSIGEAPGYDTKNFRVDETREPVRLVVEKNPAAKAVLGANSDFQVVVKDQYGDTLDSGASLPDSYTVVATVTGATYASALGKDDNAGFNLDTSTPSLTYTYNSTTAGFNKFNDGFTFDTSGIVGTAEVKFVLKKGTDEISSKTVKIETIPATSTLTYSLEPIGELYAAYDNKGTYFSNTDSDSDGTPDQVQASLSKVARQVKVVVRDASGEVVAFPDRVVDVVSSNLATAHTSVTGAVYSDNAKGFVIGNKAGTGSVTVYVEAADGTLKALTSSISVKADPVVVKTISVKDEIVLGTTAGTSASSISDVHVVTEVKTTDQYGISIEKADVRNYDKLLGVRFVISDIHVNNESAPAADKAVTFVGNSINVGSAVQEFTITAVSRDGEVTASTLVRRP